MIKTYVFDLDVFSSGFNGLIKDKNFLLFFPFSLFFSKKFYKFIFQYYPVLIFSIIPIFFSIFLYINVGNNFFRVFYHGYFPVLFSLIFLSKVISEDEKSKVLLFISFFFIIDFIFILLNINQHGFFEFFQITRYSYLSGYYIFNLTIFIIILFNFKKIFKQMKNNLLFLEINEFDLSFVSKGAKKYNFKKIIGFLNKKKLIVLLKIERRYNLDPWVQWVSVHTGKSSKNHKIFKLDKL